MLLPVILFGALWAELNQPISKAEYISCIQGARWWTGLSGDYYRLHGIVLATRLKHYMTPDQVEAILGYTSPILLLDAPGLSECWYNVLDIRVMYRSVWVWSDIYKRPHSMWIVEYVEAPTWLRR